MRNRYFEEQSGRFVQRDPLGVWTNNDTAGAAYAYAALNPSNLVEPVGLFGDGPEKRYPNPVEYCHDLVDQAIAETRPEEMDRDSEIPEWDWIHRHKNKMALVKRRNMLAQIFDYCKPHLSGSRLVKLKKLADDYNEFSRRKDVQDELKREKECRSINKKASLDPIEIPEWVKSGAANYYEPNYDGDGSPALLDKSPFITPVPEGVFVGRPSAVPIRVPVTPVPVVVP